MNKDLFTPQEAFEIPVLKILIELGARGAQQEVLKHLENEVNLLDGDWQPMRSGRIRWHSNVSWTKYRLVKKGEVDSPKRGVWLITEKGRQRYEAEGVSYDQAKYHPILPRSYAPRGRVTVTKKQRLIDPNQVTSDFLQRWGINQGLNLFELGIEGVKRKYVEYYRKQMGLEDGHLLKIIKTTIKEIKAFLTGDSQIAPTPERICQWIDYCYLLEMHEEGARLFNKVPQNSIPEELYRRTKKIADACQNSV